MKSLLLYSEIDIPLGWSVCVTNCSNTQRLALPSESSWANTTKKYCVGRRFHKCLFEPQKKDSKSQLKLGCFIISRNYRTFGHEQKLIIFEPPYYSILDESSFVFECESKSVV